MLRWLNTCYGWYSGIVHNLIVTFCSAWSCMRRIYSNSSPAVAIVLILSLRLLLNSSYYCVRVCTQCHMYVRILKQVCSVMRIRAMYQTPPRHMANRTIFEGGSYISLHARYTCGYYLRAGTIRCAVTIQYQGQLHCACHQSPIVYMNC